MSAKQITGLNFMWPVVFSELKEAADRAQTQYRLEKQKRKETELRVSNMEEELQDLKTDKEGLESVSHSHTLVSLSACESGVWFTNLFLI